MPIRNRYIAGYGRASRATERQEEKQNKKGARADDVRGIDAVLSRIDSAYIQINPHGNADLFVLDVQERTRESDTRTPDNYCTRAPVIV